MRIQSKTFTWSKKPDGNYFYSSISLNNGQEYQEIHTPEEAAARVRSFRNRPGKYRLMKLGKGSFLVIVL